jgi:hypothetical protein
MNLASSQTGEDLVAQEVGLPMHIHCLTFDIEGEDLGNMPNMKVSRSSSFRSFFDNKLSCFLVGFPFSN